MKYLLLPVILPLLVFSTRIAAESYDKHQEAQKLIQELVEEDSMDQQELEKVFSSLSKDERVLQLMSKAPEREADWGQYSRIFLNDKRIAMGKTFLREQKEQLNAATEKYHVPKNIITAILGVETYYGKQTGSFTVARSLATLAFDYPARQVFFRSELKHFLRLAAQGQFEALQLTGSYAGAMGYPQFMPSSYTNYAVDFDDDDDIDIWADANDAIGSIANYLSRFGWEQGLVVAYHVQPEDSAAFIQMANNSPKPLFNSKQVQATGLDTESYPTVNNKYSMIVLTGVEPEEYWIGTENFHVISRYNPSYLYTMAVVRLAQLIDPLAFRQ